MGGPRRRCGLTDGWWRCGRAFRSALYGVALDIGSTTLSAHLCDLATGDVLAEAGRMNPQIRFGEDLMSRVSWVMMHPGGEAELTAAGAGSGRTA